MSLMLVKKWLSAEAAYGEPLHFQIYISLPMPKGAFYITGVHIYWVGIAIMKQKREKYMISNVAMSWMLSFIFKISSFSIKWSSLISITKLVKPL